MTTAGDERTIGAPEHLARQLEEVAANVGSVLYGKREVVRLTLACLAAGGHLLIEDLPGVGKTTLAKALAQTLGLHCRRVQFTADLLPSDLIGAMVLDRERMTPVFHPGPGLHQHPAGRRVEPGLAQGPVGPARSHGGGTGERGRGHPPAAQALHGDRHPEPLRLRGHLPASLQPAGPVPVADQHRLSGPAGRGPPAGHRRGPAPARVAQGDRRGPHAARPGGRGRQRLRRPRGAGLRARPGGGHPPPSEPALRRVAAGRPGPAAHGQWLRRDRGARLPQARRREGRGRGGARAPPGRDLGRRVGWLHLLLVDRRAPGQHPGARPRPPVAAG